MPIHTMKIGTMEYLVADGIAAPHCFTTRLGGVSTGHLASLNLGMNRGDMPENVVRNYQILEEAIGFDVQKLVLANQVHGDVVRAVTSADHRSLDHRDYPACDGLITNTPGVTLAVFTADCTPILLHDPITGAVGAVHAGWRGTAADIAGKAVGKMAAEFGCLPENIRAAIGPNIGPCCFETDADVPASLLETFGPAVQESIRPAGEKFYVNLKAINALSLRRAGVAHIDISAHCTMCSPEKYWSHRYTRGQRGSQGALITCEGGKL
jgi:YfiH family protein